MTVLGIETSCDETSAAVVQKKGNDLILVTNIVSSSLKLHAKTGGIIPEIAAREQLKYIMSVIDEAIGKTPIDAIAVTVGPGLIGSLLVGVETARTLAYVWKKPIIPINHLFGHIYANWIDQKSEIVFPAIGLVVSGGHTDLIVMKNKTDITVVGGTRDDAAGEAFDKIGRLLGLPYPAGPTIAKLAEKGNPKTFPFPRPLIGSDDLDFSFSGLKTAVMNKIKTMEHPSDKTISDICASTQYAIVDVLVKKTIKAVKKYNAKSILLGGGVAANEALREAFTQHIKQQIPGTKFFAPTKNLCTDNAAMIAAAAMLNGKVVPWDKISADPELYFQKPA